MSSGNKRVEVNTILSEPALLNDFNLASGGKDYPFWVDLAFYVISSRYLLARSIAVWTPYDSLTDSGIG